MSILKCDRFGHILERCENSKNVTDSVTFWKEAETVKNVTDSVTFWEDRKVKGKFNINDFLSQQQDDGWQQEMEGLTEEKPVIHMIDVHDLIPSKENFYRVDDDLKESIKMFGILQPLLVKRPENGKCVIIAGHRRRMAVMALLKEGYEERRYVPCVYKNENITDKLALILANRFRDKTNWERMMEAIEAEELVRDLKKEYDIKGRTRSILEDITGISNAQMARYRAIYNNLTEDMMEEFKNDNVTISVIAEACKLSPEAQHQAFKQIEETGSLTVVDVQQMLEAEMLERKAQDETRMEGKKEDPMENAAEEDTQEGQQDEAEADDQQEDLQPDHPKRQQVIQQSSELMHELSYENQRKVLEYIKKLMRRK